MTDTLYYEDIESELGPVCGWNQTNATTPDSFGRTIVLMVDKAGRIDAAYPADAISEANRR